MAVRDMAVGKCPECLEPAVFIPTRRKDVFVCDVCLEKVNVNYVVIDRKLGLYCCQYCSESEKFRSIIKKTNLEYKDKHKLIEYKKKIEFDR